MKEEGSYNAGGLVYYYYYLFRILCKHPTQVKSNRNIRAYQCAACE
jgi:hypothetical protein